MKLTWDGMPEKGNARNSEGTFIRLKDNRIMFAYSRFNSDGYADEQPSDIAAIYSEDEGESWSQPRIIVHASWFGVKNIMSASAICQKDGNIVVYFLIKESKGNSSIGRAISTDGISFISERCDCRFPKGYYVINNDRFITLSDGRIAVPAARHAYDQEYCEAFGISLCLVSEDDGKTFCAMPSRLTISCLDKNGVGMQEPGLLELKDGTVWMWARTSQGAQYECFSRDGMMSFTNPAPSVFTSPVSPMEVDRNPENGDLYAVYNPVPLYNGRVNSSAGWGRIPLVIRKSIDDGRTWGRAVVIEEEEDRGYCYPAMFFTKDHSILCAYCRGGSKDKACLNRLGIMKISLEEINVSELE